MTSDLISLTDDAVNSGSLLPSSAENLKRWINEASLPQWVGESIAELLRSGQWDELNDRFYKSMAFGTGGLRGRTIGRVTPAAELGKPGALGEPEHAGVGSNMLNDFTIIRATMGLFRYTKRFLEDSMDWDIPKLVITHDVRHYSRHFCELAASVWTRCGGQALIFDGPRSTPALSFAIRCLKAHAGVNITASHNPPHDNGYKAYFGDGGQVVPPHANGIIEEVEAVTLAEAAAQLAIDLTGVVTLGAAIDDAYLDHLEENILDIELFEKAHPRIVFTPNHGTGQVAAVPAMRNLDIDLHLVEAQMPMDGRFPETESPNPENRGAFVKAIALAEEIGADGVIATDPDADRLGCGARTKDGSIVLYTGNQLGSALAEYRVSRMKEIGILPPEGSERAALIKTFVTTPLQEAIARENGLKCINTLTGFKWIGEKLHQYEQLLLENVFEEEGIGLDYDQTDASTRIQLHLDYGTFYVFGGEESYGYLASDLVRDKDANAAIIMFCELMAYLKTEGITLQDFLDAIYLRYGYYEERLVNLYFEGAAGSAKIENILKAFAEKPPVEIDGVPVASVTNFAVDDLEDADGHPIPKEKFFMIDLQDGYKIAVRGSGTEPKIKFYCFAQEPVGDEPELPVAKDRAADRLTSLSEAVEALARELAEG